jgi:hypothetical protein
MMRDDLFRLQLAFALFAGALLWVGLMPDEPVTAMLDSAGAAAMAGLFQMLTTRS